MFGRPPSGGLLSSWGRGVDGSRSPPRFGAGPNMRAPFVRAVLVVLGAFGGRVCRTFSSRGAARQTSSQTYATNLVSSLASSLCASASRPYPKMLPRLYRARLSLLPRMLPILRACDTLWSKMRGVLPEIRWFSSNECALGCTLGGSAGVGNGKSQVNVLCLLSNDSSMPSVGCHVDENHLISGMLRGSDCITARERKLFCCSKRGNVISSAAIGA